VSIAAMAWAKQVRAGGPGIKAVLLVLADYADEAWSCWPSQQRIAEETEQSLRTVRDQLARLEQMGLIARQARFPAQGRGRLPDRYVLAPGLGAEPPPASGDTPPAPPAPPAGWGGPGLVPGRPMPADLPADSAGIADLGFSCRTNRQDLPVGGDQPADDAGLTGNLLPVQGTTRRTTSSPSPLPPSPAGPAGPAGGGGGHADQVPVPPDGGGGGGVVDAFLAALGPGWLLGPADRARITPLVTAAVAAGWGPAQLAAEVGTGRDQVRCPGRVLAFRLRADQLPPPPARRAPRDHQQVRHLLAALQARRAADPPGERAAAAVAAARAALRQARPRPGAGR